LPGDWTPLGNVSHVFTHFSLSLSVLLYSPDNSASLPQDGGEWWPLDRLDEAGLPTLFAKAAQRALGRGE
jgi:A/G-specific adenine glycosylase